MSAPVEIQRWSLLCEGDRLDRLRGMLSPEEMRRAGKFVSDRLARRWIAGRAGLRRALAERLATPPEEVAFAFGPMGKPRLEGQGDPPLHFNLAHSGDDALLVVGAEPVGVDIEQVRPMPRAAAFAERWFHASERQRIAAAPDSACLAEFFRVWTAKEAALKLLGRGVGEALPRLLTPSGDGWATDLPSNELGADRCWITRVDDLDGFAAAVATRTKPASIEYSEADKLAPPPQRAAR